MRKTYVEQIEKTQHGISIENGYAVLTMDTNEISYQHTYNLHTHHMLEISIIKSGTGTYEIGSRRYDIQPNDVFFIGNTDPHRICLKKEQVVSNMVIHFETSFLWNFFGQMEDISVLDIFFNRSKNFSHRLDRGNPSTHKIYDMVLGIEAIFIAQKLYSNFRVKILMESILCEILCNYNYCNMPNTDTHKLSRKDIYNIDEVMKYINFNIEKRLTLQELAQIACVSPTYFSTIFKRYNGAHLFEYITQKRVNYAVQMIKTTDKSLTEIAMLCGFNSSTSFNKAFQRITGCSPSSFRKKPLTP